jgi:tetratricopeptide (TPR) repeat protein
VKSRPSHSVRMLLCLFAVSTWGQNPPALKPPAKANSATVTAQAQFKRGDLAAAESSVWFVLSSNPNDEQALTLLGMIRGRQQRYPEAEVLFGRVLQLNPKSVVAHTQLASALAAQNKEDEAISQYQDAINLAPDNPDLRLDLAALYVRKGEFAQGFSTLKTISPDRFPVAGVPLKATILLAVGKKSDALQLLPQVKNSPTAAIDLAEVFLRNDLQDEALQTLTGLALKRPPARFYYVKGRVLQAKGQIPAALASLRQASTLDPKSADTLVAIAEIYAAQNKHGDSFATLQRARTLNPESVPVLRRLVVEAMQAGQHGAALAAANELVQKSPENLDDLYLAAAVMLQEKELTAAIPLLEKYVAQRSDDAKGWLGLGMAYVEKRRPEDARKALERSARLNPALTETQYQLGVLAGQEGKTQEGIQHFEQVVHMQPRHAMALAGLGALYIQTRELEKALNALQRAEAIDPNNAQMQYDLGLVLSSLGKPEEARVHMQRFQKLKQKQPRGESNRPVEESPAPPSVR